MSQPFKIAAFVVFAAFPLLEIALLIRVGELIGIWRLAAIIIGTALLGTYVIRRVGLSVFERALSRLGSEREGFSPLFDGFMQVVAGLLLIFPGRYFRRDGPGPSRPAGETGIDPDGTSKAGDVVQLSGGSQPRGIPRQRNRSSRRCRRRYRDRGRIRALE